MKLGDLDVHIPLYSIDSDVTYRTERKPTAFERMVLRLCDPARDIPERQSLTLLSVFQNQLGAGDVDELLVDCIAELTALGALPNYDANDSLELPIAELELTNDGLDFLHRNSLPVRSRMIKIRHDYDPISNEFKLNKKGQAKAGQIFTEIHSVADQYLRPHNPSQQIQSAIVGETHDWLNATTVIERISPIVHFAKSAVRVVELTCCKDGVLSVAAKQDAKLQDWLRQADPEVVWDIFLGHALTPEASSTLPLMDNASLQDMDSVCPANRPDSSTGFDHLLILGDNARIQKGNVPTIILSSDIFSPELASVEKQLKACIRVPTPPSTIAGFKCLRLLNASGKPPRIEISGNFKLYWAGQSRLCTLTGTLNHSASEVFWTKLRKEIEQSCLDAEDPVIAFAPLAWCDASAVSVIGEQWLIRRAEQSPEHVLSLAKRATDAIALWRHNRTDWKLVWEDVVIRGMEKALRHIPDQLNIDELIPLLREIGKIISKDKARSLQSLFLHRALPIKDLQSLEKLRNALLPISIPDRLLSNEIRQLWVQHALERKELKLYGPHALQQPLQEIAKIIKEIYLNIGEKGLKEASKKKLDVRFLKPNAPEVLKQWNLAREKFNALKISSPAWNAFNETVINWEKLVAEKLAPVESGARFAVFDTSALMADSGILKRLQPKDIPVVSTMVLTELDGLKNSQDRERAANARSAIKALEDAGPRIRRFPVFTELLPSSFEPKQADHATLSTALHCRLNDVVIVSVDISLRNKAQSLGFKAQDLKSFMPQPLESIAAKKHSGPRMDKL